MPKLPLKKTERLAERQAIGQTIGQAKATLRVRNWKATWKNSIREHIGKAIDRIDPFEIAVMIPTTYVVYTTLKTSVEVAARIVSVVKTKATSDILWWLSPAYTLWSTYAEYVSPSEETKETMKTFSQAIQTSEGIFICLSILIAFLLVRHGGQLLGLLSEGTQTISSLGLALLG